MGFTTIDTAIVLAFLTAVAFIGSFSGGKQKSTKDYFLGGSGVPWWAAAFSIVAAETSSLTFISLPGLAYVGNLNFLQLTLGYLTARTIIAVVFLPAYKKGKLATAYAFLEQRFGHRLRRYSSVVFIFTRIAADGVRLFATAIPLALIFKTTAFFQLWSNTEIYIVSILLIAIVSLIYTYTGGVKGVIWADVVQMSIYIGGALIALYLLLMQAPSSVVLGDKLEVFNFDFSGSLLAFFREPYTFIGAFVGGTFLSLASHGTDQLIVQKLLSTRTLRDSQKAIVASAIMVMLQFILFMAVGMLLYKFFKAIPVSDPAAPFHRPDEIFPYYIIHSLPVGIKGIIVAGLFAAGMSTLAGSMSSMSSSVMFDLYKPLAKKTITAEKELKISRLITITAGLILIFVAFFFITISHSVVEVALAIASITYGGLLGVFLLGLFFKKVSEKGALVGFSAGIVAMLSVSLPPIILGQAPYLHWTWFVFLGTLVTLAVGNLFRKTSE